MDPASGSFAPGVPNASSKLVTASSGVAPADSNAARSYAMRWFNAATNDADLATELASGAELQVSINGSPFVTVDLTGAVNAAEVATRISTAVSSQGYSTSGFSANWQTAGARAWLYLEGTDGNVFVRRSGTNAAATNLRFGAEQGGIEVTRYAGRRPAPTGVTLSSPDCMVPNPGLANPDFDLFDALISNAGNTGASILLSRYDVDGNLIPTPPPVNANWAPEADLLDILAAIRDAVVAGPVLLPGEVWPWTAELWGYRLAIRPTSGPAPAGSDDNRASGYAGSDLLAGASVVGSVRYYSLGTTGLGIYQLPVLGGADGLSPTLATTYDDSYDTVRREVDLFNLMILPRSADQSALSLEDLWPNASIFAQERRALLLMEPPLDWSGAQQPMNEVTTLRIGLSKQYAALYYPRITLLEGRLRLDVGATGALAGLMARIDGSRGVWKAPAGTEADLRGIVELMNRGFSNKEISLRLRIETCTAKNHVQNILHKLGVHRRGQAVAKLRTSIGQRFS
jgi:hypothetical protein